MRPLLLLVSLLLALPALAQDWQPYRNDRFGYAVEIPPGFSAGPEPANGDGLVFTSANGTQLLRVYGGNILEGDFEAALARGMGYAREAGWSLSYERVTPDWASYSGTRNGMILYARAIALCAGTQYASYELEYPERDLAALNPVIERLNATLVATGDDWGC